ncbi:MAG: hypothetical protein RR559_04230, partial [Bacteroides sp.]
MKRVNIQNDVESRNRISASTPKVTVSIHPETPTDNATSQENKAQADIESEPETQPQKRGRKT